MNPCGPYRDNFIIPQSILGVDVRAACLRHDRDYREGRVSREEADNTFLRIMLEKIRNHRGAWLADRTRWLGAYAYFAVVR